MYAKEIKIVADSSCDILKLSDVWFESVPLKIIAGDKEYRDDAQLNVSEMVDYLLTYNGRSSSSCPNTMEWIHAFDNAEKIICFTITGTLSGSYNAACLAKKLYEEQYPGLSVFVVDTLSAGPEIGLYIEKAAELIAAGKPYEDICDMLSAYREQTGLVFMLKSLKNLASNGRVNPVVAKAAGFLGIHIVGKASEAGELDPTDKCRGEKKALGTLVRRMEEMGFKSGKVRISHCFNETAAKQVKDALCEQFMFVDVQINECRGLCSYYAENGGLLVAFEKGVTA